MNIEWQPISTAPKNEMEPFLVLENRGLFSGGWTWHKAGSINGKFFNVETKLEIVDPEYWIDLNKVARRP